MSLRRMSGPGSASNGSPPAVLLGKTLSELPAISEFLSMRAWANGDCRQLGTVTLYLDGCTWKAVWKDKDRGMVAFLTALTPEELLALSEAGLEAGTLDWRPDKPLPVSNRK